MTQVKYFFKKNGPFYRDMRRFADDKTVLDNPHKGWYLHFIDNGVTRPTYRNSVRSPEDISGIPGMPFLYLRIDWVDIEKDEGVFDWSYIDEIIDIYGSKGYKFMFRFCTYEGNEFSATPKWVFEKGAKYYTIEDAAEPVYDDPIYKEYLDRFIKECAKKLDGKDFVESVDIGTFGTWGEGHTEFGSYKTYSFETLKWHVNLHLRYFKSTQLIVNDDMIRHLSNLDDEESIRLATYCKGNGLGIRDDSINVEYYVKVMGFDSLVAPDLFDFFKDSAPVDLEFEHYGCSGTPERFGDGLRHIEALRKTNATYAGFHGHANQWYSERKNIHDYLANRLGYWYFINGLSPTLLSGSSPTLTLYVENKGFSKAYHNYTFKVEFEDENGNRTRVFEAAAENEKWLPNEEIACKLKLNLSNVSAGTYKLFVGLFEGETPIKFAIEQERYKDGYYMLDTVTVE